MAHPIKVAEAHSLHLAASVHNVSVMSDINLSNTQRGC